MNITLRSTTLHREDHYVQKVKAKAYKKDSKTPFELLSKAEQTYAFTKPSEKIANNGFLRKERFEVKEKGKPVKKVLVLPIIRHVAKVNSEGVVINDNLKTVNHLLRRILVFKGHHFDDIHSDVKQSNKPVTYAVNTSIEVQPYDGCKTYEVKIFKVADITVKKTFINVISELGMPKQQRCIFFDAKVCKKVNAWLNSLDFQITDF